MLQQSEIHLRTVSPFFNVRDGDVIYHGFQCDNVSSPCIKLEEKN